MMTFNNSDISLIGLAVMGQNLALNIADHGLKYLFLIEHIPKPKTFLVI